MSTETEAVGGVRASEIPAEFWPRFYALRRTLFAAIARELAVVGYCKNYEGTFSVVFPNYHEEAAGRPHWFIQLSCYVIGQSRHFEWAAHTPMEALKSCERDVLEWIEDAE